MYVKEKFKIIKILHLNICWTKNGSGQGGTGQALRIAKAYNIPIFDAGKFKDFEDLKSELKKFVIRRSCILDE